MSIQSLSIVSYEWGWENIRRDVFQLVAWGFRLKEAEIRACHLEEDITGLIRKGINEKLDEDLDPRFVYYSAKNEDPVDDDPDRLGKDRPRIDILIECSGSRPRKRFRLEGKRCARNSNPISWYVKGIGVYVQRVYAGDSPEAGLIGLVQDGSVDYWRAELTRKLRDDLTLACQGELGEVEECPDGLELASSSHERTDGTVILLFHLFIECQRAES